MDGWQDCNCSTRQDTDPSKPKCPGLCFPSDSCTFHDTKAPHWPKVRPDRFPDMKSLVQFGHSLGLKVGTYLNNCICMEAGNSPTHYDEDVAWLLDMGFDGVKIDACSSSHNVSHWAALFNATGRPVRIENCHNSWPDFASGECPMNFFRTGGDISANIGDIIGEAYGTVDAADLRHPRSVPGCWGKLLARVAYPCLGLPVLPVCLASGSGAGAAVSRDTRYRALLRNLCCRLSRHVRNREFRCRTEPGLTGADALGTVVHCLQPLDSRL